MNNSISLQKAIAMTTLFRQEKDNIVNPNLAGKNILPISELFDREIFDAILVDPNCVKMRIYAGLNDGLQRKSLVVGVNAKDEDILPSDSDGRSNGGGGHIGEDALTCPPICGPSSPLNP